jgi:nitrite reductase (NADH) small subunit
MQWKTVCKESDLIPDVGVAAMFEGQQVAIFYMPSSDKKVFALSNWDPFSKANVISRGMLGDLEEQLVVSSPIYKQHFILETGRCIEEDISINCWAAQLVDGEVQLSCR